MRPIITAGRIEGFQGMAREITDRVIAQSELRAERDFVSAILDAAPSLIMVLDAQGRAAVDINGGVPSTLTLVQLVQDVVRHG